MKADEFLYLNSSKQIKLIDSLLNAVKSSRDRLIIKLIHSTGITPSELVSLRVSDFKTKKKELLIRPENTKNNIQKRLPLSASFASFLSTFLKGKQKDDFVFSTRQSTRITTRRVEQVFSSACSRAKLDVSITPRTLRRLMLKNLYEQDNELSNIKSLTGIQSLRKKPITADFVKPVLYISSKIKNSREKILFDLIVQTGCTVSEIINLKVRDIRPERVSLYKNSLQTNPRKATISSRLYNSIISFCTDKGLDDYLFSTRQSPKITARRIQQIFRNLSQRFFGSDFLTPSRLRELALFNISSREKHSQSDNKFTIYSHGSLSFAAKGHVSSKKQKSRKGLRDG